MDCNFKGCKIKSTININEIITISKQSFSEGYFFKGESHNFYEIVCVTKGAVGVAAEKNVFTLSKGQMTIHTPLEFHAIREIENSKPECIILSFSASVFPKIKSHIYNIQDDLLKNIEDIYHASKYIFDIYKPLKENYSENDGKTEFDYGLTVTGIKDNMSHAASAFVKKLELFLLSALESPSDMEVEDKNNSSEHYAKIIEVMTDHINDKLCMNELSRLCGISSPLIEKVMYKYLRCGAISYYNNIRMNKAHYLLSQGESVKNVAFTLGFSTQNYFSLSFKKTFGISPSEIKKTSKSN